MSIAFDFYYSEFVFQVLLASLLGGLIGLERDIHGRAAGLRTHLLVSLGAATFTILSIFISKRCLIQAFRPTLGELQRKSSRELASWARALS